MKKTIKAITRIVIIAGFIIAVTSCLIVFAATDAPHNASNNINCGSCHGETIVMNSPFWGTGTYDQLCLSCHRRATGGPYSQTDAPAVTTHSDSNGSALAECRDCHNPHYQRQKVYKNTDASNLYLATGKILLCEYSGKDPLTNKDISTFHYSDNPPITYKSGTGWDATKLPKKTEDYRGAILFPHVNKLGYNYPITAVNPTAKTITVNGNLTTECNNNLFSSATFAVMYGQYIKDVLNTKTVKFFDQEGANSFADGDTTYNGVCEVCHTLTDHYRNDGGGSDPNHTNIGGAGGDNCISCHTHLEGFKASCNACHGYPPTVNSATSPNGLVWILPVTGSVTAGAHNLHVNTKSYQCDVCHHNNIIESGKHNANPRYITLGFYMFSGAYQGGSYDGQSLNPAGYNTTTTTPATSVTKTGSKTCSNLYCHGSTLAPDGGTAQAIWNDPTSAACGTCHGALTGSPPTKGSHPKHAGSASGGRQLVCTVCHYNYTSNHVNGSVNWAYDTATYTWLSGALYRGNTSGSQTPVPSTSYGQCSNLYCHSNGTATPVYSNPTWGDAASGACGTCHGVLAATPPASTPHTKHVGLTGYKYSCSKCHDSVANATADSTTQPTIKDALLHVDHVKDVIFDTFNTGGSYSGVNCNNIYCHSKGTGGTSNSGDTRPVNISTPPSWSGTTTCGSCHGGGSANGKPEYTNGSPKTNSHVKHTTACSICHYGTTTTDTTITDKTKHLNKLYDLQAKAPYSFSYLYNVSGGTCSNISCHMNGSAQWGATLTCSSCHGFPPSTNAHYAHTDATGAALLTQVYGSTEVKSNAANYAFGCGNCHPTNLAMHANLTVDISLNPVDGGILKLKNDPAAYRTGTGGTTVCNKIYCHSNGAGGSGSNLATAASDLWGTPRTANKCGQCHGNPPQYASAGAGVAGANSHYNSTGFMDKEGGHLVGIHFDNVYSGTTGFAPADNTTSSRHGNSTVATTISCYNCHSGEVSSTTIDTYALYNLGSSSMKCANCHPAGAVPLQNGAITNKGLHINGTPNVNIANAFTMKSKAQIRTAPTGWTRNVGYKGAGAYDSSTLNSADWNSGTKTCTTACHLGQPVQWGDANVTCYSCHTSL